MRVALDQPISNLLNAIADIRGDEPLDGDEIDDVVDKIRDMLDEQEGNK